MIILFGLLCAGATDFGEGRNFRKREGSKRRDLYLLALLVFGKGVGSVGSGKEFATLEKGEALPHRF